MLTSKGIIERVALESKVNLEKFTKAKKKDKFITNLRHLTYYILRKYKKLSYPSIAYLFGLQEHTSVMRALQKLREDPVKVKEAEKLWECINNSGPFIGKQRYIEAYNFLCFLAQEYHIIYENVTKHKKLILISMYVLHKKWEFSVTEIVNILEVSEFFIRAKLYCLGEDITHKGDLLYEKFLKNWEVKDYWEKFIPNYKTSKVEVRRCYFF